MSAERPYIEVQVQAPCTDEAASPPMQATAVFDGRNPTNKIWQVCAAHPKPDAAHPDREWKVLPEIHPSVVDPPTIAQRLGAGCLSCPHNPNNTPTVAR
jgi:hypothetical protein